MALLGLVSGKLYHRDRVKSLKYESITNFNLLMQLEVITAVVQNNRENLTNALSGRKVVCCCSVASGTCN
jgi:hypothetical protein